MSQVVTSQLAALSLFLSLFLLLTASRLLLSGHSIEEAAAFGWDVKKPGNNRVPQ